MFQNKEAVHAKYARIKQIRTVISNRIDRHVTIDRISNCNFFTNFAPCDLLIMNLSQTIMIVTEDKRAANDAKIVSP